ncbi:MAG TPA: hypothetical protein VJ739_08910 [Gemmataceae bacterium]|nr:hypothetical protein [Gemmataceae bacterium]
MTMPDEKSVVPESRPTEGGAASEPPAPAGESDLARQGRDAALAAWDDYSNEAGFGPATRQQYRSIATRFLSWLGSAGVGGLGEINSQQVEFFLDVHDAMPTTKTHYRSVLRRFFDALVARGLLPNNPLAAAGRCPEPPLTMETLPAVFAAFTPAERQATLDAASFALMMHAIWVFNKGEDGEPANVALCEAVLQLGEQYGVTALSWVDEPVASDSPAGQAAGPLEAAND